MANKNNFPNIVDRETTGDEAALLINDNKRLANELVDEVDNNTSSINTLNSDVSQLQTDVSNAQTTADNAATAASLAQTAASGNTSDLTAIKGGLTATEVGQVIVNTVQSIDVTHIVYLTEGEYEALPSKDPEVMYVTYPGLGVV